jgi:hypothetical protein
MDLGLVGHAGRLQILVQQHYPLGFLCCHCCPPDPGRCLERAQRSVIVIPAIVWAAAAA